MIGILFTGVRIVFGSLVIISSAARNLIPSHYHAYHPERSEGPFCI
jgi:hypothetical protein